jgi:hypothetical protein
MVSNDELKSREIEENENKEEGFNAIADKIGNMKD